MARVHVRAYAFMLAFTAAMCAVAAQGLTFRGLQGSGSSHASGHSFSFSYAPFSFDLSSYSYSPDVDYNAIQNALGSIVDYYEQQDLYSLVLVGEKEQVNKNFACDCEEVWYIHSKDYFKHLVPGEAMYEELPHELREQVDIVNAFTELPTQPWNQHINHECGWLGYHTLGLLTTEDGVASKLHDCGYGLGKWEGLRVYLFCL